MNWKLFKKRISELDHPFQDETKFILGIDIGSHSSVVSFWNVNRREPEMIDMSGGYGRPSIPTVIQYIPETKEWVYGEYALLNKGYFEDITFTNLIGQLGTKELVEIDRRPMGIPALLAKYIRELMEACKNINPNGEVVGVIAAIPPYMPKEAKEELQRAFALAGIDKEFIDFMTDRECILRYLYQGSTSRETENVVFLDFGSRELRGGLYEIRLQDGPRMEVFSKSSLFDPALGTHGIDEILRERMLAYYCEETGNPKETLTPQNLLQIESFAYQNKNLIFQAQQGGKPIKLYFNFAYPAFQKTITEASIVEWTASFRERMETFFQQIYTRVVGEPIPLGQIRRVIAYGGGFEMGWAKELVQAAFPHSQIQYFKNPEGIISLGACIGAASILGLAPSLEVAIEDSHQLHLDIGVKAQADQRAQFIPLLEKNSFWWQNHAPRMFIVNQPADQELQLTLYKRNEYGDESPMGKIVLKELPQRPSRTTRLKISMEFETYGQVLGKIKDCGFGELFPATDYEYAFTVNV